MATINGRIQFKTDTKANWESTNPVLLLNELVIEKQENGGIKFKLGDGTSNYTTLNYVNLNPDGEFIKTDGTSVLEEPIPFAQGIMVGKTFLYDQDQSGLTIQRLNEAGNNIGPLNINIALGNKTQKNNISKITVTNDIDLGNEKSASAIIRSGALDYLFGASAYTSDGSQNGGILSSIGHFFASYKLDDVEAGIQVGIGSGDGGIYLTTNHTNGINVGTKENPFIGTQPSHIVSKKLLDDTIASMNSGGVKILPKTINVTDWIDVQNGVWKITVQNSNITSTQYITVDASADEIIEHMTDTPIASLVVSTPTDGSVDIFVISDTKPTKQYDIRLIIQESSIIS